MAKKISAIVIPAVIDTTGIDKGINSIKTKLSGVRGSIGTRNSGTGGVGGGGNFGAGLPHYGGSALAMGAAAGIGAAVGSRGGVGGGTPSERFRAAVEKSMSKIPQWRNMLDSRSNAFSSAVNRMSARMTRTAIRWEGKMMDSGAPPGSEEFANRQRNINLMSRGGNALNKFAGVTGRAYTKADFGGDNGTKMSYTRAGVLFGGTLAVANQMRKNFTQGGIKSNFSDISNLEGNRELYERAAAIKRRTFGPSGQPTFAQSMVLGAEEFRGAAGGGSAENLASKTDTLVAKTGNLLGQSIESNAGIILNAYESFRNSPWGGGIKMVERLSKIFS